MYNQQSFSDIDTQGAGAALLVIDAINDLEFPGGEELLEQACSMARHTAALKERAAGNGIPTIYVNEPALGQMTTFSTLVGECLRSTVRGRLVVELLRPEENDYFIIAPQKSGVLLSKLDTLAKALQFHTLILTGLAAGIQARFAANDTYLTNYRFVVPGDCVASRSESQTRSVLTRVQAALDAEVLPSVDIPLLSLSCVPVF